MDQNETVSQPCLAYHNKLLVQPCATDFTFDGMAPGALRASDCARFVSWVGMDVDREDSSRSEVSAGKLGWESVVVERAVRSWRTDLLRTCTSTYRGREVRNPSEFSTSTQYAVLRSPLRPVIPHPDSLLAGRAAVRPQANPPM